MRGAPPAPPWDDAGSRWALGLRGMTKASGGDGIPVELFQILEDDTVKVLHSICQQICTGKDPDAGRDWGQEEKGTT